jgi:deazaflavin-dependent oxidoreductase (nitroreductase family)
MNHTEEAASAAPAHPLARVFPIPGTTLDRVLSEPEFRREFHAKLKKFNPVIVALYRIGLLPLFGAARSIMLLTTMGRKSGKSRQTPVGYFRIGGVLHLFSAWGKRANWYKNLVANPENVTIRIGLRKLAVRARVLGDPAEIQRTLEQFVTESPQQAHSLFGWDPAQDRIETADFSAIIDKVLVVRFEEKQG